MNRKMTVAGLAAGALCLAGLAAGATGASAMPDRPSSAQGAKHACTTHPKADEFTCFAMVLTDGSGRAVQSDAPLPAGFTPTDVQKAYGLKGLKSKGAIVAVVDAYGYSTLEADLKVYRDTYGLPACTVKNGCLMIRDERGGTDLPPDNAGWDLEQALDVDMVSAACPDCRILVMQGKAPNLKSLGHAVSHAAKLGAVAISNSYGGGNRRNSPFYDHPGVAITASTGDNGYQGGSYPASDTHVIAVGGTSVVPDGSQRGYSETVWSGAGSGCGGHNRQPDWQQKVKTTCKYDAMADVSGAANPAQGGLSIYYNGHWTQVGGTSESSPLIASVFALSGKVKGYPAEYLYQGTKYLYDITSGSNGSCGAPLCTAGKGWDGPTGLGTPNGIKGF